MQSFLLLSALLSAALPTAYAVADAFVVNCAPLTTQRSDPIVSPAVASGHVHSVVGGNAFSRNMSDPTAVLQANATTCDKKLDHSIYWVPQLYHQDDDGKFELVPFNGAAVYYLNRACNYTEDLYCDKSKFAGAFPPGFRMIAGDTTRREQNTSDITHRGIDYMCMNDDESHEVYGFPVTSCKLLRAQVFFPSCWDGVNLDSATHKSHVSYPTAHYTGDYGGGVCPTTHPIGLISLFYEFFFDTSKYGTNDPNANSRLVWANGDATGYGLHGDFIMGWTDVDALAHAHENCAGPGDLCPINTAGSSPSQPAVQGPAPLLFPAVYEENIGLDGSKLEKLPGNNPVTTGPGQLSAPAPVVPPSQPETSTATSSTGVTKTLPPTSSPATATSSSTGNVTKTLPPTSPASTTGVTKTLPPTSPISSTTATVIKTLPPTSPPAQSESSTSSSTVTRVPHRPHHPHHHWSWPSTSSE